jgi:response regulator RpfG family c-di-GMP phosphodiesterase
LEKPGERQVLWVDDRPANNVFERAALESYGIRFTLVESTSEAETLLAAGGFDAVISDLGRPDDQAGLTLLRSCGAPATPSVLLYQCHRRGSGSGGSRCPGVTADRTTRGHGRGAVQSMAMDPC